MDTFFYWLLVAVIVVNLLSLIIDGKRRTERRKLLELARTQNHYIQMIHAAEAEQSGWAYSERDRLKEEVDSMWDSLGIGR